MYFVMYLDVIYCIQVLHFDTQWKWPCLIYYEQIGSGAQSVAALTEQHTRNGYPTV